MVRVNYFPTANLKPGTVNIHGFWHGFPGYNPPKDIARIMTAYINSLKPQDYLLIEGPPYEFGKSRIIYEGRLHPVTTQEGVEVRQGTLHNVGIEDTFGGQPNLLISFLLQVLKSEDKGSELDLRTELAEFYFNTILFNEVDKKIRSAQLDPAGYNATELVKKWSNITFVAPEEVEALKQAQINSLEGKVNNVSLEEIALFVEKLQTGRSLLLARTGDYRARALGSYPMGGKVEQFIGCMHAGEVLRFLKNPEAIKRYLSRTHDDIREVYERNEEMQEQITGAFHSSVGRQKLNPRDRTLMLKQIVDNAMVEYMRQNAPEGTRLVRL